MTRLERKAPYSLDHLAISGEVVVRVVFCWRAVTGVAPSCFIYLYFLSCISLFLVLFVVLDYTLVPELLFDRPSAEVVFSGSGPDV